MQIFFESNIYCFENQLNAKKIQKSARKIWKIFPKVIIFVPSKDKSRGRKTAAEQISYNFGSRIVKSSVEIFQLFQRKGIYDTATGSIIGRGLLYNYIFLAGFGRASTSIIGASHAFAFTIIPSEYVCNKMNEKGRQSKDRFIFVVNKCDGLNPKKDGNIDVFFNTQVSDYLKKHKIVDANVFPVYVGNGEVVHYSYLKEEKFFDKDTHVRIVKTSYEDFANGSQTYREPLREDMNANSGRKTAKIAKSLIDNDFGGYNLVTNNCEHFANYCKYNEKLSFQIKDLADKGWFDPSRSMIVEHYVKNNILIPKKYEKINL